MVTTNEKKVSAGRVLIVPRGEWDENITYEMLDLVNHNGYAYLCKKTVIGIEPSNANSGYWHNMLDINKIVENSIANTVAEDVGDILEARFRDVMSEAKYVADLNADYDMPTFVKWDSQTDNTPYTNSLTECTEGFALVYGVYAEEHIIVAWTKVGECFTHRVIGGVVTDWDKTINSSGGNMTGPLGLGGGKGTVSADDEGTYIEAVMDAENYRQVKVENPSGNGALEDAVKFVSSENGEKSEFSLFGTHNPEKMASLGYAKIKVGTYVGNRPSDVERDNKNFKAKIENIGLNAQLVIVYRGSVMVFFTKAESAYVSLGTFSAGYDVKWSGDSLEFRCIGYYSESKGDFVVPVGYDLNSKDTTYNYIAFGF